MKRTLSQTLPAKKPAAGRKAPQPAPRPPAQRRVIGTSVGRPDLFGKVTGGRVYIQDLELPGMLHGRAVRPPGPNATLGAIDDAALRALPGVVAVKAVAN